jgi:hypothetical protein
MLRTHFLTNQDRVRCVEQVNVTTCLERWAEAEPEVGLLYDLLCDMVYPNIGSAPSVAVPHEDGLRVKVRDPESEGVKLFQCSFPAFMSLTEREEARLFQALFNLFLAIENERTLSTDSSVLSINGVQVRPALQG